VGQVLESEIDRHLLDADIRLPQSALGVFEAKAIPKLVRRGLEILAEKPDQMIRADVNRGSQVFECQRLSEIVGVQQIDRLPDALVDAEMAGMPDAMLVEHLG
jgi:hypothetical protein